MNNSCVVSNNKIHVTNEKGTIREIDYQDNFKSILEIENKIETLENGLKNIKNEIDNKIEDKKYLITTGTGIGVIVGVIMAFCAFQISLVPGITILGIFESALTAFCLVLYKIIIKEIKALNKQYDYAKETLDNERKNLDSIKNEVSKDKCEEINNEIIKLKNGKELLEKFLNELHLEYIYEYYKKRIQSLSRKEKLEDYLQKNGYTSDDINYINELASSDEHRLSLINKK